MFGCTMENGHERYRMWYYCGCHDNENKQTNTRAHRPFVRLDGSTGVSKRQKMVDAFNLPGPQSFAFLLSRWTIKFQKSKSAQEQLNVENLSYFVSFTSSTISWRPKIKAPRKLLILLFPHWTQFIMPKLLDFRLQFDAWFLYLRVA